MNQNVFNTLSDDKLIAHGKINDVQGYTMELLQRYEKALAHIGNIERAWKKASAIFLLDENVYQGAIFDLGDIIKNGLKNN
jgi:hypothetical protein